MRRRLDFTLFRMAEATADLSLADQQTYKAAVAKDYHWLGAAMVKHYHGDDADMGLLQGAVSKAFAGMDVDAFAAEVREWFATATHPVLQRPYLSCGFEPMIELLRYLEANRFRTYIASGGDRDFMRPFTEGHYGIPPERVIGSALGLDFDSDSDVTGRSTVADRVLRRRSDQARADLEPARAPPEIRSSSRGVRVGRQGA